jgi:hypothetical protein
MGIYRTIYGFTIEFNIGAKCVENRTQVAARGAPQVEFISSVDRKSCRKRGTLTVKKRISMTGSRKEGSVTFLTFDAIPRVKIVIPRVSTP